ncbi:MAG: hypothetical protein ACUVWP_03070 [bacterium]
MKAIMDNNLIIVLLFLLILNPVYAINWDPNIYLIHNFDYVYTNENTYISSFPRQFQLYSYLTFIHPTEIKSDTIEYNIITMQFDLGIVLSQFMSMSLTVPIIYDDSMKELFPDLDVSEIGITNPWMKGRFIFRMGNYLSGGIRAGVRLPVGTERYTIKPLSIDLSYLTNIGYEIPFNTQIQIGYRYEGRHKDIKAPSFIYLTIKEIIPIGQRIEPFGGFGITFPLNKYYDGLNKYEAKRCIWFDCGVSYTLTKTSKITGFVSYGFEKELTFTDKILIISTGFLFDIPY